MKKLIFIIMMQFFTDCSHKNDTNKSAISQRYNNDCSIITDTISVGYAETFTSTMSIEEIQSLNGFEEINPQLKYHVNKYKRYKFKIADKDFFVVLDSCKYQKKIITTFNIDSKPIDKRIVHINDSIYYGFDNLAIDYNRSKFYYNSNKNLLFIKNYSERLVGRAVNWKFCQLVDISKLEMFEFYLYDEL